MEKFLADVLTSGLATDGAQVAFFSFFKHLCSIAWLNSSPGFTTLNFIFCLSDFLV